ncbi:MAG: hypothetical protein LBH05_03920 [Deferribacteraceae bacterium]|jgi:hypothetical protein|nr:hypothetical protein [Deferribacteraceae bacterium]
MNDNQFSLQLKKTVGQFRADLDSAFGDKSVGDEKQKNGKSHLEENDSKPLLTLTEYLLCIKEKQVAELEKKSARYYLAALQLSGAFLKVISDEADPDSVLAELCGAMDADSLIIWRQTGKDHLVQTINIDKKKGEELFVSMLPYLSDNNVVDAVFTGETYHIIANTRQSENTDSVFAALYIRGKDRTTFEEGDSVLAKTITDIIYNLFGKSE